MADTMADAKGLMSRAAAHPTLRQFVRFALAGGFATIVHYAVMAALIELAGFGTVLATSIGFLIGVAVSFFINRTFTFASQEPLGAAFLKYLGVFMVGLPINSGLVWGLESLGLHYVIAQPIATAVVLFWNFGGSRLIVFRGRTETPRPVSDHPPSQARTNELES